MDPRRVNDLLKTWGPVIAIANEVAPLLPDTWWKHVITGLLLWIGGLATRGYGQEDKAVTEAKLIARLSMHPPALVVSAGSVSAIKDAQNKLLGYSISPLGPQAVSVAPPSPDTAAHVSNS